MPDKDLFVILKKVCIQIICIEKGEDKEEMENALHYKIRACHTQYQKEIVAHIHKRTELRPGEPKILEYLLEHRPDAKMVDEQLSELAPWSDKVKASCQKQ